MPDVVIPVPSTAPTCSTAATPGRHRPGYGTGLAVGAERVTGLIDDRHLQRVIGDAGGLSYELARSMRVVLLGTNPPVTLTPSPRRT